jgi:hypothetical protein
MAVAGSVYQGKKRRDIVTLNFVEHIGATGCRIVTTTMMKMEVVG